MALYAVYDYETRQVKRTGFCPDGQEDRQARFPTERGVVISKSVSPDQLVLDEDEKLRFVKDNTLA